MKKKTIVLGLLAIFMLVSAGCNTNTNEQNNVIRNQNGEINTDTNTNENTNTNSDSSTELQYTEEGAIKPKIAEQVIKETSTKVMTAIKGKDFATVAEYAHPEKGVRFSTSANVDVKNDLVFTKEELKDFFTQTKESVWGLYGGSGLEIKLTPAKYFEEFIYSRDFLNTEHVGYNKIFNSGAVTENQFEVYPDAIIIDYYMPADPDMLNWESLRLAFQQHEGKWYLVGIIHHEWEP